MKIYKHQLNNGLKLLSIEDLDSNSISIMVLVRVGSRYEDKKTTGLAHFVEHNFFKGTKKFPTSKAIGMAIEKIGGSSNAFTSYDYTGYYIKVPKENFHKAMEIMADIINNSIFPKEEVERERGVVIEEIKMYDDIPMRKVANDFMRDLFGKDHPLGRDITGSIKSVSSFSRSDILKFVKKYYSSENIILSIAGGIENSEISSEVTKYYSTVSKGKKSEYQKYTKKKPLSKINVSHKELEQSHLILGGFGIPRGAKDRFAMNVGLTILGKGFGSKLFQIIREKLGLAYYIHTNHSGFDETGVWEISMGVDNKRIIQSIEAVIQELKDFKRGNFDSEDLERSKNFIIGNLITDLETSDDIAVWYGIRELLLGYVLKVEEYKEQIAKIQKDDVIEIWDKILDHDNIILNAITSSRELDKLSSNIFDSVE